MRIVDILAEDLIVPDLRATTKHEVLDALCARVSEVRPDVDHDVALRVLEDRERLGSTGVGNGFAVPHGKLGQLDRVVACFARSRDGVAFDALDGQPAHLFLALLAPQGAAGLHLKALARASRLFKDADFRSRLIAESDPAALWRIIREQDEQLA